MIKRYDSLINEHLINSFHLIYDEFNNESKKKSYIRDEIQSNYQQHK